jgi:GT2 family glycosyltransferase
MDRRWYHYLLSAFKTFLSDGWSVFWWKTREFIKYRMECNTWPQLKKSREEETLETSLNGIEASEDSIEQYYKMSFRFFITQYYGGKLCFPVFEAPIVSIIVLANNKAEFTYKCLESICANTEIPYEVILVDNGSTDETDILCERLKNVKTIINKENVGFIRGCNQAAKQAQGKYLMFLNNDAIVTPQWLSNMVKTIERSSLHGAVGCKLVNLSGKLQEAGSIIWSDGTAMGYGRGDYAFNPEYSYQREVDYCSGACLLVRLDVFRRLGEFDERYAPAYYEDSDLCMGIHRLGYKVVFDPGVMVFHHEFTSIGSFEDARLLMESNRKRFVKKWGTQLKEKMARCPSNILDARDLRKGDKILLLDDRIPAPNQGSGYPRAHSLVRCLNDLGYRVTFFPVADTTPWQPYTHELQNQGVEIFYGNRINILEFARKRFGFYGIIIISRYNNVRKNINTIKECFKDAAVIYDSEALFSTREIIKAEIRGNRSEMERNEGMLAEELNLMKEADLVITVSENEKTIIKNAGVKHVEVWGHSLNPKEISNKFSERKDILFVGGFLASQSPNEDAILHFAKHIFPSVQKALGCKLFIVGINPPESVKELSSFSIEVTGYVEDLTEYYERCRIFVVPHRFCSGIPCKLQEAMNYGIPSVVSSLIASQLNLENRKETLIAETSEKFIEYCIELYRSEKLWYEIQANALNLVRETCNPEVLKIKLDEIVKKAKSLRK